MVLFPWCSCNSGSSCIWLGRPICFTQCTYARFAIVCHHSYLATTKINTDHVAHHFFSSIPFCGSPAGYPCHTSSKGWWSTKIIYRLSQKLSDLSWVNITITTQRWIHWSENGLMNLNWPYIYFQSVLRALWRSFTQCVFVEDEGDIVFFKNQYGEALLEAITTKKSD